MARKTPTFWYADQSLDFFALTTPALSLASPSLEWRKGVTAASFSPPSTFEKINLWNLCPSQSLLLLLLPPPLQLASWKEKRGESRPPPFLPRPAPHPKHPKEKEEEDAKGERGSLSFFGEGGRREAGQWDKRGRREGGESLCVVVKKYPFSLFRSLVKEEDDDDDNCFRKRGKTLHQVSKLLPSNKIEGYMPKRCAEKLHDQSDHHHPSLSPHQFCRAY